MPLLDSVNIVFVRSIPVDKLARVLPILTIFPAFSSALIMKFGISASKNFKLF